MSEIAGRNSARKFASVSSASVGELCALMPGNGLGRSMDRADRLIGRMGPRYEISGCLYPDGITALTTAVSRSITREGGQDDEPRSSGRARAGRRRSIAGKKTALLIGKKRLE